MYWSAKKVKLGVSIHRWGKNKKRERQRFSVITESLNGKEQILPILPISTLKVGIQKDNWVILNRVNGTDFSKWTWDGSMVLIMEAHPSPCLPTSLSLSASEQRQLSATCDKERGPISSWDYTASSVGSRALPLQSLLPNCCVQWVASLFILRASFTWFLILSYILISWGHWVNDTLL